MADVEHMAARPINLVGAAGFEPTTSCTQINDHSSSIMAHIVPTSSGTFTGVRRRSAWYAVVVTQLDTHQVTS
jgi:hypothetical protein